MEKISSRSRDMSSMTVTWLHTLLLQSSKVMLVVVAVWSLDAFGSRGEGDTTKQLQIDNHSPDTERFRLNSNSTGQSSLMDLSTTHTLKVTSSLTLHEALSSPNVAPDRRKKKQLTTSWWRGIGYVLSSSLIMTVIDDSSEILIAPYSPGNLDTVTLKVSSCRRSTESSFMIVTSMARVRLPVKVTVPAKCS